MPSHDIIAVGASAGGVETLKSLVALLPGDLPAAMFVVQHLGSDGESLLPEILSRHGSLKAVAPRDLEEIRVGHIYVAPKNQHLLVEPGRMRVIRGPRENRHRPAIDPLFRSAAWAYGPRVVGVVLTGYLDDGSAGLWAIRTCGGVTVVQSAEDALYPDMPRSAALTTEVDYTLTVPEIAELLDRLAREPVDTSVPAPPQSIRTEVEFSTFDRDMESMASLGTISPFTCPACRGALWELEEENGMLRYRCHTGHAYSKDSLLGAQASEIEEAVYTALRAVEEKATTLRKIRDRYYGRSGPLAAEYDKKADDLDQTAEILRSMLAGAAM